MMQCIAIDDEPLALEIIRKYASETPMINLKGTFTDAIQSLSYLKYNTIDLLILDIQMPDISGIQFLQALNVKPMVIFTTAYTEYAVKGFELEAIDYLMKPFTFERFLKAIIKAEKVHSMRMNINRSTDEYFFVKSEYQTIKIFFEEVHYIESFDDYIRIHLHQGKLILSLMSLKSVMEKLPSDKFMRVHRSYIVPLQNIRSVRNKRIYLDRGDIPVGDTYNQAVQQWLSGR